MPCVPAVLITIPVYNHAGTLRRTVKGALAHGQVLVVDDGSTDMAPPVRHSKSTADAGGAGTDLPVWRGESLPVHEGTFAGDHPLHGLPVHYLRHAQNRGKGKAVLSAASYARKLGMTHIITLDADAQHEPDDIPAFLRAVEKDPLTLFVGVRDFDAPGVPFCSRFGRAFSNFWYKVHTGRVSEDTQSGFRAYPLAVLDALTFTESRYSFETEVLVRSSWAGFASADIPIRVNYRPPGGRISHFCPFMDNLRLTLLNTRFTIRSVLPVPQKQFAQDTEGRLSPLNPMSTLRILLCRNETPKNLALAGALGVFLGTLPIFGFHSLSIILLLGSLRLNKLAGLATSQLCMPPLVPALCIEAGHYMRYRVFLTEISVQTLGYEAWQRIWEWILGSLLLAPLFGILCGIVVYVLARIVQRGLQGLPEEAP
ncbi:MAG: DUF2062 domain-containing protein [Desulfovibrio sp.]|jgi:glycosyltransferase involved in cell wall biosynthesis/uncharacterized protein (DUF2062 family)|nr:DUF2062 domain-containing protein [Desulfovibrio sp.]